MRRNSRVWRRGVVVCVAGLLGLGCSGGRPPTTTTYESSGAADTGGTWRGVASYYSDSLHGRTTASGEAYDKNAFTAAHRSLPFGTRVRVRRIDGGRSVVVRINDRGPFVEGREIDVSRRAAEELGFIVEGLVPVDLRVVDAVEGAR